MSHNPNFSKFHGVDRDTIQWNPVIDKSKCIGCGMCATTCGRSVFKFDYENKKAVVANPDNCMVACQTCANLCPVGAISFVEAPQTTREKAQKIIKKNAILVKVKGELDKRREQLDIKVKTN